ncbi:MAG: hypothetical protein KAT46_05350 [Deltaproteobacteria bacterium]|nr:hypothetical protein [Deltaproteobacteria bacterium]
MNIKFETKGAIDKLTKRLNDIEKKHIPFAGRIAATNTVVKARKKVQEELNSVIDRPTRMTQKAVLYEKSTHKKPSARVFLRDRAQGGTPPTRFLKPLIEGGGRNMKAFEKILARRGLMLWGERAVPAKGFKLNRYGNITGGMIKKMLSDLRIGGSKEQRQQYRAEGVKGMFFVPKRNHPSFPPGVYMRYGRGGSKVRGILMFVKKPTYKKRFDFHGLASKVATKHFPRELSKAFKHAWNTRKR